MCMLEDKHPHRCAVRARMPYSGTPLSSGTGVGAGINNFACSPYVPIN